MDKDSKQVVVLLTHPNIKESRANKALMDAISDMGEVAIYIYMRCVWKMLLMQRYGALSYRMHLRLYFSFRSIGCRLLLY